MNSDDKFFQRSQSHIFIDGWIKPGNKIEFEYSETIQKFGLSSVLST